MRACTIVGSFAVVASVASACSEPRPPAEHPAAPSAAAPQQAEAAPRWVSAPVASADEPAPPPVVSAVAPPSGSARVVAAPAACVGAQLAFDAVVEKCRCQLPTVAGRLAQGGATCDVIPSDTQAVQTSLRPDFVLAKKTVAPGGHVVATIRYANTSTEPLHVLLDRDATYALTPLDAQGVPVPDEIDPRCHEVATLSMATFSLVVLPPGGVLEVPVKWRANKGRRVPAGPGDMGCTAGTGAPLKAGDYGIKYRGHHVWELRDVDVRAAITVK